MPARSLSGESIVQAGQILLKEEQMSTSVMERAAEALAVIQQIVTSADDPMDGLPPRQAKENVAFEDDTMERGATNNVGAAATDACPAPNTTPSPLAAPTSPPHPLAKIASHSTGPTTYRSRLILEANTSL